MKRELIDLEDARRMVLESCARLPEEPVALDQAHGRVLAAEVRAESAVPGFDNSTMDGFAVRAEDTAPAEPGHPVRLLPGRRGREKDHPLRLIEPSIELELDPDRRLRTPDPRLRTTEFELDAEHLNT